MKKFFVLLGILASAMVTQSAFAKDKTCQWVYNAQNSPAHWNCDAGNGVGQFDSGVLCKDKLPTEQAFCDSLGPQNPTPNSLDDCPANTNCGNMHRDATFDFNIQAGGSLAALYVCEAGFANKHCAKCGSSRLDFYNGTTLLTKTAETDAEALLAGVLKFWTFSETDHVTSANLFINDLNEDVGFYVKYCMDVKRLIVGGAPYTAPVFKLNDVLTLTPGAGLHGEHKYFDVTNLKTLVYKRCGLSRVKGLLLAGPLALEIGDFGTFAANGSGIPQSVNDFEPELFTLTGTTNSTLGTTCYEGHCEWTVLFKEMNTCMIRAIDCDATGHCGSAREARISTKLDFNLDFCPNVGDCD